MEDFPLLEGQLVADRPAEKGVRVEFSRDIGWGTGDTGRACGRVLDATIVSVTLCAGPQKGGHVEAAFGGFRVEKALCVSGNRAGDHRRGDRGEHTVCHDVFLSV